MAFNNIFHSNLEYLNTPEYYTHKPRRKVKPSNEALELKRAKDRERQRRFRAKKKLENLSQSYYKNNSC